MADINSMSPQSGRVLKENNEVINTADILAAVYDAVSGVLKTSATVNVGDIEIGAIEIKDATSETRAVVGANGLNVDVKAIAAGTNHVGKVGYTLKKVKVSVTRPADTTAYAVGDAITNSTSAPVVFELDLASVGAVVGQACEIRKVSVASSAKQSTLPLFNLYLAPTTFTATNDNAALDIDDTTMEDGGSWFACDEQFYTASNCRVSKSNTNSPMILAVADTKIYGTLQAANIYTPVSGEKFTIVVWVALL